MVTGRRPEPGSFGQAERDDQQVIAASVSMWIVWLNIGEEEVVAHASTREEATVKAMNLALERLQQQTRQELEETDEGREVENETGSREEEKEQDVRTEGQEQTLDVSDEEETVPGPSAAVEPEGEEFSWSRFENIILSWLSEEQTEERDEQSVAEAKEVEEDKSLLESGLNEEAEVKSEEMLPEEHNFNMPDQEEKSVPEPSASEAEEKESGGRGFSSALRFWLSKEQGVCKKVEKERDEPRVVATKEETKIVKRRDKSRV
ncbi:hypothetical protein WMY93_002057 [Mugilogobius chulae]|uniref:Uncharacterized protein n=1 Tax=Mugilogobius chulae TaxID=88201 RepID=A0AAW0PYJ0_9GOBI